MKNEVFNFSDFSDGVFNFCKRLFYVINLKWNLIVCFVFDKIGVFFLIYVIDGIFFLMVVKIIDGKMIV